MNALVKAPILNRDDLSFAKRDNSGCLVNWPANNPGVASDWEKGKAFFDGEIFELAGNDETEAFQAIEFAILGMGGRYTSLELGFAESVALAAVIGLRALRGGAEPFTPIDDPD